MAELIRAINWIKATKGDIDDPCFYYCIINP